MNRKYFLLAALGSVHLGTSLLSVCPSVSLSAHLSVSPSVHLSVCPSVSMPIYQSVHLSLCLSVSLSVCLSIRLYWSVKAGDTHSLERLFFFGFFMNKNKTKHWSVTVFVKKQMLSLLPFLTQNYRHHRFYLLTCLTIMGYSRHTVLCLSCYKI